MTRTPSRLAERLLCLGVAATSLGATCVPNPNERPPGDMAQSPVGVGFAEIEADVKGKCLTASPACHSPATTNAFKIGDDRMANYQTVKSFVTEASPADSVLLQKAIGMGTPAHGGGPILTGTTDATYQKWLKWIQDGLLFDPTVKRVTFADIETDMSMSCLTASPACHGPTATNNLKISANRAANYLLVKGMFLNLATPADSPLLKKAIGMGTPVHGGGAIFPSTTDATYQKWLGWITGGAPEK